VANQNGNSVTVINGASSATTTINAGSAPFALAVNPVTNRIYVANYGGSSITVINGANNATTTVSAGSNPDAVAVNPVTNKIYIANYNSGNVTIIDGISNATTTATAGSSPFAVAVNPVTGTAYAGNQLDNDVTVITESPVADTKIWAINDSPAGHLSYSATPVLSGKGVNRAFSGQSGIEGVYTRVNTCQSAWNMATITSGAGSDSVRWSVNWGTDSLIYGENFLCMFAADSQCATINSLGRGTPLTGNVMVYPLYRVNSGVAVAREPALQNHSGFALTGVYPNPFRDRLEVEFTVPGLSESAMSNVAIAIYDMSGRLVHRIAGGAYAQGHYRIAWDAGGSSGLLSSNVYLLQMKADNFEKKVTLLRVR